MTGLQVFNTILLILVLALLGVILAAVIGSGEAQDATLELVKGRQVAIEQKLDRLLTRPLPRGTPGLTGETQETRGMPRPIGMPLTVPAPESPPK